VFISRSILSQARATILTEHINDRVPQTLLFQIIFIILKHHPQLSSRFLYHHSSNIGQIVINHIRQPDNVQEQQQPQNLNGFAENEHETRTNNQRNDLFLPLQFQAAIEKVQEALKQAPSPYASFFRACKIIELVFSAGVRSDFEKWGASHCIPYEAGYSILNRYKPLKSLCNRVDSITRLYPLQRAIDLGLEWIGGGVKEIFTAEPDVLKLADPNYGLLPFQLAAATATTKRFSSKNDCAFVDLSFNLLRQCPKLVSEKLFNPHVMKWDPEFFTGYQPPTVPKDYMDLPIAVLNRLERENRSQIAGNHIMKHNDFGKIIANDDESQEYIYSSEEEPNFD